MVFFKKSWLQHLLLGMCHVCRWLTCWATPSRPYNWRWFASRTWYLLLWPTSIKATRSFEWTSSLSLSGTPSILLQLPFVSFRSAQSPYRTNNNWQVYTHLRYENFVHIELSMNVLATFFRTKTRITDGSFSCCAPKMTLWHMLLIL